MKSLGFFLTLICTAVATLTACSTTEQQKRFGSKECTEKSAADNSCENSIYTRLQYESPTPSNDPVVGFFEYNSDGNPFDSSLHEKLLNQIETETHASSNPVLMVAFIHGWFHNADNNDENVKSFKKMLIELQNDENVSLVGSRRKVIGVYIGWQAKAYNSDLLQLLSYKNKKELAIETGRKSVSSVLDHLGNITNSKASNRFVAIGHSFGGGLLFSAVKDKLDEVVQQSTGTLRKTFADLVVLVNPAVEADRFVTIHDHIIKNGYPKCSTVAMASFTSEADTALGIEFPAGMSVFYKSDLDQVSGVKKNLRGTPYGLYYDYVGYKLESNGTIEDTPHLTADTYRNAAKTWYAFRAGEGVFNLGGAVLRPMQTTSQNSSANSKWSPILNIRTSSEFIQEHSSIWDAKFRYFLRGMIGVEFSKIKCAP